MKEIITKKEYTEKDLFAYRGLWHSTMHHGSFSATTPEATLQNINARLLQAHQTVPKLDWLMLTFGTAYVYEAKETGKVVSNCHKLPENDFNRRLLSVDEIVDEYTSLITDMAACNATLKFLFTVSPIRHIRDGMHANQLSKSTLLLAVDRLQQSFPEQVFYSPLMKSYWMNYAIIASMRMICCIRLRWRSITFGNAFPKPSFPLKQSRLSAK